MSGADNIQFNNLERALSTDVNDTESVLTRTYAENLRYGHAAQAYSSATGVSTQTIQNVVLGGLNVTPSGGAGVFISPGSLCQDSASLSPAPGSLDSTYRLARIDTVTTFAALNPGSDTYYLLEAQMVEVVASSQIRDIFNPSTQTFVPTLVPKQIRRTIQFQWKAGTSTNFPIPTGGDWVPIAGLFRPAAGGNVTADQIYDMRVFPRQTVFPTGRNTAHLFKRSYGSKIQNGSGTINEMINLLIQGNLHGEDVWVIAPGTNISLNLVSTAATINDPVNDPSALASGQWSYVYIAPWSALNIKPTNQAIGWYDWNTSTYAVLQSGYTKGVIVHSSIAPDSQGSNTNGATITLPPPFQNITVAAHQALCFSAFRHTGFTGYRPQFSNGSTVHVSCQQSEDNKFSSGVLTAGGTITLPANLFPKTARSIMCRMDTLPVLAATSASQIVEVTGSTVSGSGQKLILRNREDEYIVARFELDVLNSATSFYAGSSATNKPVGQFYFEAYDEAVG